VQLDGQRASRQAREEQVLTEMRANVAGAAAPYNNLDRQQQDRVTTTVAGVDVE
jgi:hypothetical protein